MPAKSKAKTSSLQSQSAFSLWLVAVALAVLAMIVPNYRNDLDAFVERAVVVTVCLLLPSLILLRWGGWSLKTLAGNEADSASLVLSVVAGLAVWFLAWWVMSWAQEDLLTDNFVPPVFYRYGNWEENWTALILLDVVTLPLIFTVLLWGGLRVGLRFLPPLLQSTALGLVFGVFGMLLFGQGLIGLVGYGMAGLLAAYLVISTQSSWYGLALQGAFAYANYSFYDNLLRFSGLLNDRGVPDPAPYFGQKWLSGVLIAAFGVVVCVQVIRLRHQQQEPSPPTKQALRQLNPPLWLALGGLALAMLGTIIRVANLQ